MEGFPNNTQKIRVGSLKKNGRRINKQYFFFFIFKADSKKKGEKNRRKKRNKSLDSKATRFFDGLRQFLMHLFIGRVRW
jgi:hypothetical protein